MALQERLGANLLGNLDESEHVPAKVVEDAVSVSDIKYIDDSSVIEVVRNEQEESGALGTISDEIKSSMPSLADEIE